MFKFLKEKLKNVVNKFSKKIDEEGVEEEVVEEIQEKPTPPTPKEEAQVKPAVIPEITEPKPKKEEKEKKGEERPKVEDKIKKKIEQGKTPSIHELAQRKKKTVQPKIEVVKKPEEVKKEKKEKPKEIKEKQVEKEFIKEIQEPEELKPKPSAKDILKQVEEEEQPPKEDKDLTADELIKEAEKIVLPEDKIPTAKQLREQFEKERKEKLLSTEKKETFAPEPEAKGLFQKIKQKFVTKKINDNQFEEIFWDLEVGLMENNVALEVIEKIKLDLKQNLVDKPIRRGKISEVIMDSLKNSITEVLDIEKLDVINSVKTHKQTENKPYIICFLGINGSGKTTSIAKFVKLLQKNNLTSVISAADTFRAAAIQQLEEHGKKLNTKVIKHDYGADAAAVAFDSVKYAEAHNIDVVLIDTAGRMHSNVNLMDELKKIIRVNDPHLNIFVGESITGNDCVDQAKKFNEAVGINGIILTKADVDEKGGAALSVSYVTNKPILYLGIGQEYADLQEFDKDKIMANLGF